MFTETRDNFSVCNNVTVICRVRSCELVSKIFLVVDHVVYCAASKIICRFRLRFGYSRQVWYLSEDLLTFLAGNVLVKIHLTEWVGSQINGCLSPDLSDCSQPRTCVTEDTFFPFPRSLPWMLIKVWVLILLLITQRVTSVSVSKR